MGLPLVHGEGLGLVRRLPVDRYGLLHVVHPALLVKAVLVPALRHHTAMAVAAAPGLAHVQGHNVLPVVGQVEVGGECGDRMGEADPGEGGV